MAATDKRRERENLIADCMKQKGFTYVAYVRQPPQQSDIQKRVTSGDYEAMKETRAKYGFGVFASFVYAKEAAEEAKKRPEEKDPNDAIKKGLPDSQREIYEKASTDCFVAAVKQVYGLKIKTLRDFSMMTADSIEGIDKELNGDPKLLELADAFATCLTGKQEEVTSTKPTDLNSRGGAFWATQVDKVPGKRADGSLPPDVARPYLTKEIKSALVDLECGKDFYAAYSPKYVQLEDAARAKFGFVQP
ncbi:hypothetical protein AB0395_28160 [Streptosporangium sp. NPDC051023]|uniref:hypothetical protein n=1 Tax=Streptosporangium sp. NPDC051023 TaxID=3155410 RepID=UPI00344B0115